MVKALGVCCGTTPGSGWRDVADVVDHGLLLSHGA
jgi:hypothetical protein